MRAKVGYRLWAIVAVLTAVTLFIYWPVTGHQFVDYDDPAYILQNPLVKGGLSASGLWEALTSLRSANWHPVTWMSHMIDVQLFGLDPRGHHLVNLLLHAANAGFLLAVLHGMTGALWPSAAAASLFALHPLNAESVAWVAERKNVLSTLFWLATMWLYLEYLRKPGRGRYLLAAATFVLGLMSKPMLVTLPLALLLLDYWPLGRLGGRAFFPIGAPVREKLPLLALSVASSAVTYVAQNRGGAVRSWERIPFVERAVNTLVSYGGYAWKTLWPLDLAFFYPMPRGGHPWWRWGAAALLLAGVSWLAWRERRRRPWLGVGWLWYLGTLVPVVGIFVQVGSQAMADRYAYIPLMGLFLVLSWGAASVDARPRALRAVVISVVCSLLVVLAILTRRQQGYWRDSESLFRRGVTVVADNWSAYNSLGIVLAQRGETEEALRLFNEAIRIEPTFPKPHYNIALARARQGRLDEAIYHYREAIRQDSKYIKARQNLGWLLFKSGRPADAVEQFREILAVDSGVADTHYTLGVALEATGREGEAMAELGKALEIEPGMADAHEAMARILERSGRHKEAATHAMAAARIGKRKTGPIEGGEK